MIGYTVHAVLLLLHVGSPVVFTHLWFTGQSAFRAAVGALHNIPMSITQFIILLRAVGIEYLPVALTQSLKVRLSLPGA